MSVKVSLSGIVVRGVLYLNADQVVLALYKAGHTGVASEIEAMSEDLRKKLS